MGTAILELKLSQDLASVDQDPLLLVFMDLHKSYDTVYRGHLLPTLEVYGTGPHIRRLQAEFWEQQEVVTQKNRYHTLQLQSTRG